MSKNYFLFAVAFLLLFVQPLIAKKKVEKIKIDRVEGVAVGGETESVLEVKQRAINEAKINALKEAGISENIKTYTDYFQSETDEQYEELFASNIFTNIQGAVKEIEILDVKNEFTTEGSLRVKVVISCVVLKYLTNEDLTFDFWVEGVKPNYNHNDRLEFAFKPASDGYLKSFIFTKDEAYQLFPNDYENSRLFEKNQQYEFPLEPINYILETSHRSQMHRIVFVFLKEDIPYTRKVEYDQIFDWIFSIPPDVREVKSYSFTVFNESGSQVTSFE
jgi:hypothetical protein